MRSIRFSQPTKLSSWTWLYIDVPKARQYFSGPEDLNSSLQGFVSTLNGIGVGAGAPKPGMKITVPGPLEEVERAVTDLMARHNPTMILTILHGSDTELYNCVKQTCDLRHGVRNVCVLAERLKKANDQYFANIGLKFNLKLGGANQSLQGPDLGIINEGKTMLVGIDVTHPSPGSSGNAPSVAGMVSSVDSTLGQWPAEIKVQASRQEMVSDLDAMLKVCLQRWARANENK